MERKPELMLRILLGLLFLVQAECSTYTMGVEAFLSARYKDAMEHFRKAIAANENSANAYYYIGKMFLLAKDPVNAYQNFLFAFKLGCNLDELGRDTDNSITQLLSSLPAEQSMALHSKAIEEGIYASPSVYYVINQLRQQDAGEEILVLLKKAEASDSFLKGQKYLTTYLSNIYYWASIVNARKNQQFEALEQLRKAIRFDSGLKIAQDAYEKLNQQMRRRYQTHFDAGEKALREKQYDEATKAFEQALLVFPDDNTARRKVETVKLHKASNENTSKAEQLVKTGQYEEAAQLLRFATSADPENFRAVNLLKDAEAGIMQKLNLRISREQKTEQLEQSFLSSTASAVNAMKAERFDEAIKLYTQALEIRPDHKDSQDGLAEAKRRGALKKDLERAEELMRSSKFSEAYPILIALSRENPPPANLQAMLVPCLYHTQRWDELLPVGRNILAFQPQNKEVLYYMAIAFQKLHEAQQMADGMEQYETFLERIIRVDPSYLDASKRLDSIKRDRWMPVVFLVMILLSIGALALWWYKTRDQRKKSQYVFQMDEYTRTENWEKLREMFQDFYSIDFDARETIKVLPTFMQAQVECSDFDEALKTGTRILAVMPEHRQAKIQMARAHYGKGALPPNTVKFFKELLDSEFISDSLVEFMGEQVLNQDLKSDDTAPILKKYVSLHPENDKARKMLLDMVYKDKRIDKQVLELLQLEVQYNPTDTRYRLRLAEYHLTKKNPEECIRLCEEVINIDVTEKKLHGVLFEAYEQLNQLDQLQPVYDALLQTYPNNIVIQEAAARVRMRNQAAGA